jgi:hypothetical protein
MFTTVNKVKEYTNKTVELSLINRAQALIEIFIGRTEIDVENPSDLAILDKMTAYQAAYMMDNEDMVYSQIAVNVAGAGDSLQSFDNTMMAPFLAPLAVIASRGLSFKKPRSIRTGKIFQFAKKIDWRTY